MYLEKKVSARMVAQGHPCSCGAACARQLLLDTQKDVSEAHILEMLGDDFIPDEGIHADPLATVLSRLMDQRWIGGPLKQLDRFDELLERAPILVMLDRHWVIVDGHKGGSLLIRDPGGKPGGNGFDCIMERKTFETYWAAGVHRVVFRQ